MEALSTVASVRERLATLPRPIGFVPTMGALHAGHLALVEASRRSCASTIVSIFVNPMQFAEGEDYEGYPRDLHGDRAKLAAASVDVLFEPQAETIYPREFSTVVDVGELGTIFEGASRPGHFRGVATVVTKLLHIVQPDMLFLGQKDAQQTAVLRKLIRDLDFPVRAEIVETMRDPDGLALSSRNAYLSSTERAVAPSLHAALEAMLAELRNGATAAQARERALAAFDGSAKPEYLDLVDADTFAPLERLRPPAFAIGAARFGQTRLIDNLWIKQ